MPTTRPVRGPGSGTRHRPKSSSWIRPQKRRAIYLRDLRRCAYCGCTEGAHPVTGEYVELSLDHILPCAAGGSHDPTNLLTSCCACNRRRGNTPFQEFVGDPQRVRQLRAQARRKLEPYLFAVALEDAVRERIEQLVAEGRLQWVAPDREDDDIPF